MNAGDISVPKPAFALGGERERIWRPYGLQNSSETHQREGLNNPMELICRQFVVLWEMVSPAGHILCVILLPFTLNLPNMFASRYGCSDISRHDLQRLCYKVTEDLFAWKANLPSNLEIDLDDDTTPKLPHLLMLQ